MYDLNTYTYGKEHSYLLEYISKCKSGDILTGHELMLQLDMLLDSLEDPNIKFEMKDAHKRIKFIESKCKLYEAPFAGKQFKLMLFQKAFIEAIYSFKIFDDEIKRWVRKFQDVLLIIGRKNGKSPLVSAIDLAEFFCGPLGIKILCSSNDYEQADIMFQAIEAMREQSPSLAKCTRKNIKGIFFGDVKKQRRKGKFSWQNKGNIRKISSKTGAKEGRNIMVGSFDEVHELKDNTSTMPIRQALSTQDEPLYFEITTEGFTNDGYLDKRLKEARQVLNGELERPRWLIWIYTQDSENEIWQDESTWVKSNPGLGTIKKWSFIRRMIEESQTDMSTRAFVLAKDFNIKQNNSAAWLREKDIVNELTFSLEDLRNCFAIGGTDLSLTGDLTSARILIMKKNDPKKYFYQRYFIPENKLDELGKTERKRYEQWIADDLITVSPGSENDFRLVSKWYYELFEKYNIRVFNIGYDRYSAVYFVKELEEDYGFDTTKVKQDHGTLSEPYKMLERDLRAHVVVYNNNPIDKFCLENAAIDVNKDQQMMIVKVEGQNNKKIDGAVTMGICYRVYMDNRPTFLDLVNNN